MKTTTKKTEFSLFDLAMRLTLVFIGTFAVTLILISGR